jgi:two-component system invasion response regulator UvrY
MINHIILSKFDDKTAPSSPFKDLTERELQVLLMVSKGREVDDIAEKLFLSVKTVNGHRNKVLRKLGVKTDVEATQIAIKYGLVDADIEWR